MRYLFRNKFKLHIPITPNFLGSLLPVIFLLFIGAPLHGATLKTKTVEAYNRYIDRVEEELAARRNGDQPFLFVSTSPGNMLSLEQDLLVIRNLYPKDKTPKGIIHDWLGAVFLKGVTLEQVLEVIMDVDRHPELFKEVIEVQLLEQSEKSTSFRSIFRIEGIMTVTTDSEMETKVMRLSPTRAQVSCRTTRINEISHFGRTDEKLLPEGRDRGIIWRSNSYITLDQTEGGVTLECRTVQLSRDIPFGISLILGPFLKKIAPESLESMLTALRNDLSKKNSPPSGHQMAN